MAQEPQKNKSTGSYGSSYSKRPLWQWILLYLIVGGIVYYAIYYFAFAKKGSSLYGGNSSSTSVNPY